MTVRPVGESALLAEVPDARAALALYRRLRATEPAGVLDVVPAAATVLVRFDPVHLRRAVVESWLARAAQPTEVAEPAGEHSHDAVGGPVVEIGVRYDGPDLAIVAELTGLSVAEVVRAHTASLWSAAFIGFAPGFAYLVGGDDRLDVPRRESPRSAVPAGSVALAAGYCGVYPSASPGGWQLIGRTEAELWNPSRAEPALVQPGTRVRFVAQGTA
ncbi:MAG: allophanate hydrolase subunit 1 [Herbiconiux sp.]|nr:allophanate hydrolase subunit 1 [Herbiconiux sp.]